MAECGYDELRISVSWKAEVFRDHEERRRVDEHRDDLTLDQVWKRLYADLERRGVVCEPPADPLTDQDFIDLLSQAYRREPIPAL